MSFRYLEGTGGKGFLGQSVPYGTSFVTLRIAGKACDRVTRKTFPAKPRGIPKPKGGN